MLIVSSRKNKSYKIAPVMEFDTIPQEYILKSDEDLARAIPFDEFVEGAKKHIRELYSQKKKYHIIAQHL